MPDLKKILRGCLSGNSRDQELLYRRYSAKLFAVCLQYSNTREEARDVLQESFIKIFTNLHSFHGGGSFEGWIRRIVVNTALEKHRNKYYLNKVYDIDSINEPVNSTVDSDLSGLEAEELLKFIMELPPQYKMVFNLFAIEGYSHKEIAEKLGINEGTSKSNLSRARQILQKRVEVYMGLEKRMING